jgi:hypothetical protein
MSRRRRLDRVERGLAPRDRIIAWLAEAHAFPSLPAYVDWIVDQPGTHHPLASFLGSRARAPRSGPGAGTRDGGPDPATETLFLYTLVVELNRRVDDALRWAREVGMRLLWQHLFLLATRGITFETPTGEVAEERLDEFVPWAADVEVHLAGLLALQHASRTIAARYLDGHGTLWPALLEDIEAMVAAALEWHRVAVEVGPATDVNRDAAAIEARAEAVAAQIVRSIVEWARIEVLAGQGRATAAMARIRRLLEPARCDPTALPADRRRTAASRSPARRPTESRRRTAHRPGRAASEPT